MASARVLSALEAVAGLHLPVGERTELVRALAGTVPGGGVLLGHASFGVLDLDRSVRFYDDVLRPLEYERAWTSPRGVEYGVAGGNGTFALFVKPDASPPGAGFHFAFNAPSEQAVDAFFAAALQHGGRDLGRPGKRPQYGPTYYAAFVSDPDGYKLEAVYQERSA